MSKYIIINENKVPQHSLDQTYSLEEVKDYPNLAILVEEPFIVLDIDNQEQSVAVYNIIKQLDIKCRIMKTDRGAHFWFKSMIPLINQINVNTPITIKTDIKCWGMNGEVPKKSMVTVKRNNVWREWLLDPAEIDELPFWLLPIKSKKDLFGMSEGDGRDDALFTYIIPLLKNKFNKERIRIIFEIINKFIFKEPLLQRELDKMFENNEVFDETISFYNKNEFLHNEFAYWMKESFPIEYYNGSLYIYKDGLYIQDRLKLEEIMINKISKLKTHNRQEVINYLEILCNQLQKRPPVNEINCRNGLVNIETGVLRKHSSEVFTINQLPVVYNPGTYCKEIDDFLNDVSCGDIQIRYLLEELVGYCLLNDCRYQVAFILLGQGANGKSVFLKMLNEFLGDENICSIPLEKLNGRFNTAELVNKLANIGDDISGEFLPDTSIFKKLVSGEKILVERKNQQPFQFNNVAKLIFSANAMPPASDRSYGLQRRMIILPFLNIFKKGNDKYDPNILRKLTTDIGMSYLLDLALQGLNRLRKNQGFTNSKQVETLVENYVIENNTCLQWIETEPDYLEIDLNNVYRNYCLFCASNNSQPFRKTKFINEITNKLPMIRVKNTTRNMEFIQVFSEEKKR